MNDEPNEGAVVLTPAVHVCEQITTSTLTPREVIFLVYGILVQAINSDEGKSTDDSWRYEHLYPAFWEFETIARGEDKTDYTKEEVRCGLESLANNRIDIPEWLIEATMNWKEASDEQPTE